MTELKKVERSTTPTWRSKGGTKMSLVQSNMEMLKTQFWEVPLVMERKLLSGRDFVDPGFLLQLVPPAFLTL